MKRNNGPLAGAHKLRSYSALAGAFIISGNILQGQTINVIVHTNIDPDQFFDGGSSVYELDLNNDSTIDFTLSILTNTDVTVSYPSGGTNEIPGNILWAIPENANAIAAYQTAGYVFPFAFYITENVDGDVSWYGNSYPLQSLIYSGIGSTSGGAPLQIFSSGSWFGGQSEKFLGLRIESDGDTHYGWLRMSTSDDNKSFTVIDYAFNTLPDETIETGQTELLIVDIAHSHAIAEVSVYSFDKSLYIYVPGKNTSTGSIEIRNTSGQLVYRYALESGRMHIHLADITPGVYGVRIITDTFVYDKNIFLD
ncbi:MAG: T9SS type A sorting domain-containing protein [Chitinophagales bacterium]|nr:T9SS type A sorting domain-containing protein [Chitinophagales bacterium]